jgi:hypothetical protein
MKCSATRIRSLLLVGAVAACTAATPTPSIAPVTVALVPSSPSAASPATPMSSPIVECHTLDLGISVTNSAAGLGAAGAYLMFVNDSASPCRLSGSPILIGITALGAMTTARHSNVLGIQLPGVSPPPSVVLNPGDDAFAAFGGGDSPTAPSPSCPPPYHTLQVSPPGDGVAKTVSGYITWLGQDQPSCSGLAVTDIWPPSDVPFLFPLRP